MVEREISTTKCHLKCHYTPKELRNIGIFGNIMLLNLCNNISFVGGEGGIRTPGTRKRTIDFESTALDHSATSPKKMEKL